MIIKSRDKESVEIVYITAELDGETVSFDKLSQAIFHVRRFTTGNLAYMIEITGYDIDKVPQVIWKYYNGRCIDRILS